ncbi:MAG: NAD(P)-dependent oxidoreductase [Candidatus Woesearchaeota archaeon]
MKKMNVSVFNCPGFSGREMDYLKTSFDNVGELELKDLNEYSLRDTDILVVGGVERVITPKMIDKSRIRYIGIHAAGYNNLPANAFDNTIVTNTPNYCFQSVAELGVAYLERIGLFETKDSVFVRARHLIENQKLLNEGNAQFGGIEGIEIGDSYNLTKNYVKGKVVGIVGLGKIGSHIASQLDKLGAKVLYKSRSKKDCPYEESTKEDIFSNADIVYFTCPLSEETRNLVAANDIISLRQGSVLINLAREEIISKEGYQLLYDRTKDGDLFFCDDVTFRPSNGLRVISTPHIGFNTKEAKRRKQDEFISNLSGYMAGKRGKEINQV